MEISDDTAAIHRMECLEAEIRRMRQALRATAESVLAGDGREKELAEKSLRMLSDG
jgi:hypothetical protein